MEYQTLKNYYCQKCGSLLTKTGLCPNCGENENFTTNPDYWGEIERANKRIKHAVIAGITSTVITVVFAILGLLGTDLTALIDAAIIAGLTFGVYKKNRGCAIAVFAIWVLEKLTQWILYPDSLFGLPIAILFGYFFYEGILGTFEYHRIATNSRKNQKEIEQTTVEEAINEQRLRKQEENRNSSIGW